MSSRSVATVVIPINKRPGSAPKSPGPDTEE